jgi:hypothetical protein
MAILSDAHDASVVEIDHGAYVPMALEDALLLDTKMCYHGRLPMREPRRTALTLILQASSQDQASRRNTPVGIAMWGHMSAKSSKSSRKRDRSSTHGTLTFSTLWVEQCTRWKRAHWIVQIWQVFHLGWLQQERVLLELPHRLQSGISQDNAVSSTAVCRQTSRAKSFSAITFSEYPNAELPS